MSPKFKTKNGWLTPYALNCGYIEKFEFNNNCLVLGSLSCDEMVYIVTWWDGPYRKQSEPFRHISDARKEYKKRKNMIESGIINTV